MGITRSDHYFFPKTPKFKILTFDFLEDYKGENTLGVNHFGKQK
jgi:hypothetical protein